MIAWVANFGNGAYREHSYEEEDLPEYHFGYSYGLTDLKFISGWSSDETEIIDVEDKAYEVELEDTDDSTLNGINEYSYGFWARFLWNSNKGKLLEKPDWMGLARMSTNRALKDATNPGDRTLAIWIGRGFYHFATYTKESNNVV